MVQLILGKLRMHSPNRRSDILDKIFKRTKEINLGYIDEAGNSSNCLIWTGPTSGEGRGGGYPRMSLDSQTVAVHLVIFTHYYGFIPGKKQVDHKCNNRLCIEKTHLQLVTHKRNIWLRDQRAKVRLENTTALSP